MRDTPPEFIASLFNSKSSSGSDFLLPFFEHQILRVLTIRSFRSAYQSRASDQRIRAFLVRALLWIRVSERIRASELLVFRVSRSFLVPVDFKQNRKKTFSSNRVRMFDNFCLVSRYWLKYHSCSPPFCQQSKSVGDVLKQLRSEKLIILR